MKFYSLSEIKKKKAQYNIIIGERSNGKSYAACDEILKNYTATGKQGAIIRRWDTDLRGRRGANVFSALVADQLVKKYTDDEWEDITYYSAAWYLSKRDPANKNKIIRDVRPLAYAFSLNAMEHDKSTSYPDVTTIVFDEFLTRTGYLKDEFILFMNVISTIVRYRSDVTIYMLGNTVNKDCPYFKEMGLKHIENMRQGSIDVYTYGQSKLKVAVEYCGSSAARSRKKSDIYFSFDNPSLQMITGGVWELGIYPHRPVKFTRWDIKFIYFIKYEDKLLQCEIVRKREGSEKYDFTFIHPKTTDLQSPEKDLIFDTSASGLINYSRKLNQGIRKNTVVNKILEYYRNDKVFFSDNETGEVFRNYIQWCRTSNIF